MKGIVLIIIGVLFGALIMSGYLITLFPTARELRDSINEFAEAKTIKSTSRARKVVGYIKSIPKKGNKFQELFDHMQNEHGLVLLESEMLEIINIIKKIK